MAGVPISHPAVKLGKKVVIVVGGGFGGLNAARTLANHSEVQVILIDQRNYHLFQPLLYQVATAGLSPSDIAVPIRGQFSHIENVEVHWGKVDRVDLQRKLIIGTTQMDTPLTTELSYDFLVLACGANHSYFAHPEWEEFAPGLKTLEQATEIRRRILSAFEAAENELDPVRQKAWLTFVVVGAGATGVELAGAIADISHTVLLKDFKRIDPSQARILLLEAGPRALAMFSESLSARAVSDLEALGVTVRLSTKVENITADGVHTSTEFIPTHSVFWAAGVQANQLHFTPAIEADRSGRIKVSHDLSLPTFPEVFVIGDMASVEADGKTVPGLAPAAIQGGVHAAKMILASVSHRQRSNFHYSDKGQMATIGKRRAIAQTGRFQLTGYIAWLAWLLVHILYLVGFKNRVFVLLQWAWSYIFAKRGARLITDRHWQLNVPSQPPKPAPKQAPKPPSAISEV